MTATDASPSRVADERPVVEMIGVTVEIEGMPVLHEVDLRLYPGEVHALMGGNGAGKSSLVKALTGAYRIGAGEVRIAGESVSLAGPGAAESAGIAAAFQDVDLCVNLSVAENVMIGHEERRWYGIAWGATRRRAVSVLEELGLGGLDPRSAVATLAPAMQQLVAIARAMVTHPKVLVLDEPTSSLDADEVATLFRALRRLRDQGVAILFVSHFLEQVYAISDRITVLRDGRGQGEYPTRELDRAVLISKMIGKDLTELRRIGSERRAHRADPTGEPLYQAAGVGRRGEFAPTDLELHRGEIVGLGGLRGSGRSELGQLLAGVVRRDSGTIRVDGREAALPNPAAALRRRVAFASEDRRDGGIIEELSVRENIILALQGIRGWARPISRAERDALVDRFMESLAIVAPGPDAPARQLSGGNQQKVLLARWLATRPHVLVLDEPTRGVDIAAKVELQAVVAELAREGVAVVFISSELDEVVRLSDRIVILKDRRKIGEVSNGPGLSVDTIIEMIAADTDDDA
ncbi:sugar ABC transporter ATP-binding protein [Agromyces sp. H3Y2-19a]|uniref:sugar ABC transporter ATP-binding protein n=1 Tax=Agromyces chromiiresistens TaxID=3030835 RepID=UPI0023B9DC0E|nr:sugar ABC transporter ATP-binding protein [Agromyces chromiiresistens]MDF0513683.1 sugar ABC transporter ATP-binding protein [Agromyces chromiiresistens]